MEENRILGWDDVIEEESSFTLLEPGDYDYEVVGFEQGQYNGGAKLPPCPMAELELEFTDDKGNTTRVLERLFLVSSMEWKLSEFFLSIGQKKEGEPLRPNWADVLGSTGRATLEINEYINKNGEERKNNRVQKYLPKEGSQSYTPGQF